MINIILGVFAVSALLNGLIFGGSIPWSVMMLVISSMLLIFRLFLSRKLPALIARSASVLGVIFIIVIGLLSGMKVSDSGYLSYNSKMAEINNLLETGQYFKADKPLLKIEKTYGTNDRFQLFKAQAALGKKDTVTAEALLNTVINKQSMQYYTVLGKFFMQKEDYAKVEETFIATAKAYPLWSEAQRVAGIQSVNNKDYAKGEYFLLRTIEQMPNDPIPIYYLGVIRFEQGSFTEAEKYFQEAIGLGLNEEFQSYIAWYRQQMGGSKQ